MTSQSQFAIQQNIQQYLNMNEVNYYSFPNNQFIYNKQNLYKNSPRVSNDISSADTDSYSYQNGNLSSNNFEKQKPDNRVTLKKANEFVNELFKAFGDKNTLCNFSLFEKNIDIDMKIDKSTLKKMTLKDYFECFNEASFLCLSIPFLDKKGNINYNIFNPTLSSMNLVIRSKNIIEENINKTYAKDNFSLFNLSDDLIKIQFDETNPPYNRDIIESKINYVHKILGKKKILLDYIVKENSYFSVLWTPADTYKIKTSFLSFYSFDFKLVGTLAIKLDDHIWFTTFCNDTNDYKDFKKEYLNKINVVEKFIKRCNNLNDGDNLEPKLFSQDYKRFIYNY